MFSRFFRVCWVLILIISVAICLFSIFDKWRKFEYSPVIVSFAESMTPLWHIPFPAITICSYTRVRPSVFNYSNAFNNWVDNGAVAEEDKTMFAATSLMCINRNITLGQKIDKRSTLDVFKKVGVPMSQMIGSIKWRNDDFYSYELFHPVLVAGHGICYSFNMLNSNELYTKEAEQDELFLTNKSQNIQDWSLVEGYTNEAGLSPYPHRGLGTNMRNGLTVVMNAYDHDLNYACHGHHQGFKVFVHNAVEVPSLNSKFIHVPLNQEVSVAVKPNLMTTSADLRHYTPERRQCHHPDDRKLLFYSVYTEDNCAMECLTNFTRYMCRCVSYYMPHDVNTSFCGPKSKVCVDFSLEELPKMEIKKILATLGQNEPNSTKKTVLKGFDLTQCDCLPSCTELKYDTKVTQSEFYWKQVLGVYREGKDIKPGLNMGRVSIFFEDLQFLSSRRSELYGRTDFLASCGGLLGLFMGFSILSLVEIIYFFTIRACCNLANLNKKKKVTVAAVEETKIELEEKKLQLA